MYLVVIAWMYVVLMMAIAEATASQGTVLGAVFTFLLYGVLPLAILIYIMRTPARKRARQAAEANALTPVPHERSSEGMNQPTPAGAEPPVKHLDHQRKP